MACRFVQIAADGDGSGLYALDNFGQIWQLQTADTSQKPTPSGIAAPVKITSDKWQKVPLPEGVTGYRD